MLFVLVTISLDLFINFETYQDRIKELLQLLSITNDPLTTEHFPPLQFQH